MRRGIIMATGGGGSGNGFTDEFNGSSLDGAWSWIDQGSATATVGSGLLALEIASDPTNAPSLVRAWEGDSVICSLRDNAGFGYFGLRNSANGRVVRLLSGGSFRQDNGTSIGGDPGVGENAGGFWIFRLHLDGTMIRAGVSDDEVDFSHCGSQEIATWLGGTPDQVILQIDRTGAGICDVDFDYVRTGLPLVVTPATAYDEEFNESTLDARWTWANQGGAAVETFAPGYGGVLTKNANAWSYLTQDVSALSGDWEFTSKVRSYSGFSGLCVSNADGSKCITSLVSSTTAFIQRQASFVFSANPSSWACPVSMPGASWFVRWVKEGTNLKFYDSANGIAWTLRHTESIATHLVSVARLGLSVYGTTGKIESYWIRKTG